MVNLVFFDLDAHEQNVVRGAFARENGYDIDLHSDPLTVENAPLARDADAIGIFVTSHVTREILDRLPNLKMIAAMSTGFDQIDVDACRERKIAVCNVPSYGESTVAEFAFGLILALARKFRPTFARTARGDFSRTGLQGMDLAGKTLGLIGTGRIGSHLARLAHGAGMNVVAYDLHPNLALTKDYGVRYLDLDDLLREADVISLHVPYTKATHHLINAIGCGGQDTRALVNTSGPGSWTRWRSQLLSRPPGGRSATFEGNWIGGGVSARRALRQRTQGCARELRHPAIGPGNTLAAQRLQYP